MGNGQLHQMSGPSTPVTAGEQTGAAVDRTQPNESPQTSGTGPPPPGPLPLPISLPPLSAPQATSDACNEPLLALKVEQPSPIVVVEKRHTASDSSSVAAIVSSPSPAALLSPLTPRARMLPAIVRPPTSPSASRGGSLSPRPPPSPAAASLSSPLPPPSPSAASSPTPAVAAPQPADTEPSTSTSSTVSASASTSTSAAATIILSALPAAAPTTTTASSSASSLSPSAPLSAVVPSAKPSWQLDSNEHRSLICRFCGGAQCKHEDYTRQPNYRTAAAIVGLNSSHITPSLIAMQRPSTQLIHTHGIAAQFQQLNITAIINCQQTGEHALCGPGIQPHGFSYHPDELPHTHHYNFGWIDMGTPPIERMLNIVQVMAMHEMRGGRVAVHCHAGYGRTGMVIACYLVFAHHYSADMAITTVRLKREGSVQTKEQKRFCYRFEQYIKHLRYQYHISASSAAAASVPSSSPPTTSSTLTVANGSKAAALPPLSVSPQPFQPLSPTPALPPSLSFPLQPHSLSSILTNQRLFLHGHERQQYRYTSKLVSVLTAALDGQYERLCDEIEQRAEAVQSVSTRDRGSFLLHLPFDCTTSWTLEDNSTLDKIKHAANLNDYSAISTASPFILLVALLHFLTGLASPLLPFYTYSPTLPTTLSTSFVSLPRLSVSTLDAVVRLLHALQFVALVRSSDVRPVSTFVVLAFAFALLHPNCATPSSLALLIPVDRQFAQPAKRKEAAEADVKADVQTKEGGAETSSEEEKQSGKEAKAERDEEEEGASLGSMLCFMSVLLTEWHEEHALWTKRDEEERQSTRVGTKKGERWWLGQDTSRPASALSAAVGGVVTAEGSAAARSTTPRANTPGSRRNSGKRSARGPGSRRGSRKQPISTAEPELLTTGTTAELEQTGVGGSADQASGGKEVEEESKEQREPASEIAVASPLATARGAKRGSGTRPILPPLKINRPSATPESS